VLFGKPAAIVHLILIHFLKVLGIVVKYKVLNILTDFYE